MVDKPQAAQALDYSSPEFKSYIQAVHVLIVDPVSSSRNALRRLMSELGAKPANVNAVESFGDGETEISRSRPQLLLVEYHLAGGKCGLDLLEKQRDYYEKDTERLFIALTSSDSPLVVNHAHEMEVDALVRRPFTTDSIRADMLAALSPKLRPTPYTEALEVGKIHLRKKSFDAAIAAFGNARRKSPAPVQACYLEGMAYLGKGDSPTAKERFEEGLGLEANHFRCQSSLYEILMSEKEYARAYELAQKMYESHPVHPKRLPELIRLSIQMKKFKDIKKYYKLFTSLETRDDSTANTIAAGMVVVGKNLILKGRPEDALDYFEKAVSVAKAKGGIYKGVLRALVDAKLPKEAEAFLKTLPEEIQDSEEIQLLWFEQMNLSGSTNDVIQVGNRIIQKGVRQFHIYETIIRRSLEAGRRVATVEGIYLDACKNWPEKKADLDRVMQTQPLQANGESKTA